MNLDEEHMQHHGLRLDHATWGSFGGALPWARGAYIALTTFVARLLRPDALARSGVAVACGETMQWERATQMTENDLVSIYQKAGRWNLSMNLECFFACGFRCFSERVRSSPKNSGTLMTFG